MSSPRTPQQRAINTRQRIIDTASRLFVVDGYEGTSVRDIIASARTSKGALYGQFKDGKAGVAQAIMDDTLTMDGLQPQRYMLQEVIDIGMILAHRISNEIALQAALKLSFNTNAPYTTPWPDWVQFNKGQLTQAQKNGEVKPFVDPEDQAYQIAGYWAGLVMMAGLLEKGSLHRVEERVSRMYRNLVNAIGVEGIAGELNFAVTRGEYLYTQFKG
jgi:AcrR family transcriptional regulator